MRFIGQHIYDLVSRFRNKAFVSTENTNSDTDLEIRRTSGSPTLELSGWASGAGTGSAGRIKFLKAGTGAFDTFTAGNHTTDGEILGRIEAYGVDDSDAEKMAAYIEFKGRGSDADSVLGEIVFGASDLDDNGEPTPHFSIGSTGAVDIISNKLTFDSVNLNAIQTSSESFADNDTSLMTSAAIEDKILSYGYSTGDITGVVLTDDAGGTISDTAGSADFTIAGGSGITTSGSSTTMTIAGDDATTSAKGVASFSSDNFAVSSGAVTIKSSGVDLTDEVTGTLPIANGGTGSTSTTYCDLTANVTGVLPSANMDSDTAHLSGIQTFSGRKTFSSTATVQGLLTLNGDRNTSSGDGVMMHVDTCTVTDTSTSASGTKGTSTHVNIEPPTLAATNASVTTSHAATLYVKAAPIAGTNQTITNAYGLWVDAGNARFDADLSIAGNLTITGDITSVGDDVSIGDDLLITSAAGKIKFSGTHGGGNEGILYEDSGGSGRVSLFFPGSDVVAVGNRAANGTVELRANTSTAGSGGEVTQVTVEDDKVKVKDNITCLDGEDDEFTVRPNLYFFATNTSATVEGNDAEGSLPSTNTTTVTLSQEQNSSSSVFSLASNEVTIARAGLYKMSFNVTTELNNGSGRAESFVGLVQETSGGTVTLVDGTEGRGYHRFVAGTANAASGQSHSASVIVNVAANSKYTLRFGLHNIDVSGQKLRTIDEGTSFLIEAIT